MTPKITYAGLALMVQAIDGNGIVFTKVKIGNGRAPDDYQTANDLSNPIYETIFTEKVRNNQFLSLSYSFTNSDIGSDLSWTELGIFCQNPSGGEDLLYAYAHYTLSGDAQPQYIPAAASEVHEFKETVNVYVGDSENVSAILAANSEYLSKTDFQNHVNSENPHPNMSKAAVGLDKVPNVSTNNQTPSYSLPDTLTELKSGEKLSTAMGKIALAIKKFITHAKDTNVHVSTAEKNAWNAKTSTNHTHKAADINEGVLGTARGGTGLGTFTANRLFYAKSKSAIAQLAHPSSDARVLMQDKTGAPYWGAGFVDCGTYTGTGEVKSEDLGNDTTWQYNPVGIPVEKEPTLILVFEANAGTGYNQSHGTGSFRAHIMPKARPGEDYGSAMIDVNTNHLYNYGDSTHTEGDTYQIKGVCKYDETKKKVFFGSHYMNNLYGQTLSGGLLMNNNGINYFYVIIY